MGPYLEGYIKLLHLTKRALKENNLKVTNKNQLRLDFIAQQKEGISTVNARAWGTRKQFKQQNNEKCPWTHSAWNSEKLQIMTGIMFVNRLVGKIRDSRSTSF